MLSFTPATKAIIDNPSTWRQLGICIDPERADEYDVRITLARLLGIQDKPISNQINSGIGGVPVAKSHKNGKLI